MKCLLGINKEKKTILTAEFGFNFTNSVPYFSARFYEGEAFDIENIDDEYINAYYEDLWECFYSAEDKIKLLDDGNLTKADVFENWERFDEYTDIIDCSCTDYEVKLKDGTTVNFETIYGGQHNIRETNNFDYVIFTNYDAVLKLLSLWDNYHLKTLTAEAQTLLREVTNAFKKYEARTDEFYKFIVDNLEV